MHESTARPQPIQMTFDTHDLFPSLEDDHTKFAAGKSGSVRWERTKLLAAADSIRQPRGRLFGIVITVLLAVSTGAKADFRSGNKLYADCTSPMGPIYCDFYVAGISDAAQGSPGVYGFKVCAPADATLGQMVDIARQYLAAHPERRHRGAAGLVAHALAQAFPCQ